jgi:RNA polymerase sigma-70 factor (ECF subfamily)
LSEGAGGDRFADWVRPHLSALSAVAVRQVGYDDASDIVQEALFKAWRHWPTFRQDRGSPRAWLIAILLDQARRHRVGRLRVVRTTATVKPPRDDQDQVADRLAIETAIESLPRRQREVVVLFYLADLSAAEVATVLGIAIGSVKSHLHDARVQLSRRMEEQ